MRTKSCGAEGSPRPPLSSHPAAPCPIHHQPVWLGTASSFTPHPKPKRTLLRKTPRFWGAAGHRTGPALQWGAVRPLLPQNLPLGASCQLCVQGPHVLVTDRACSHQLFSCRNLFASQICKHQLKSHIGVHHVVGVHRGARATHKAPAAGTQAQLPALHNKAPPSQTVTLGNTQQRCLPLPCRPSHRGHQSTC